METKIWPPVGDICQDFINLPLPSLIDKIAALRLNHPFFSLPRNDSPEEGYQDYTCHDFARAVDRCAWWIADKLGRSETFKTLAYIGPQDLRCILLLLASVKTGYKLQTFHPATCLEGHVSLLKATNCRMLLHSRPPLPAVYDILLARTLDVVEVPELHEWLDGKDVPVMEYTKTLTEVNNEPFWVAHSSGTTGPPKPIVFTHGAFSSHYSSFIKIPPAESLQLVYNHFRNQRVLVASPISIAAGVYHVLGLNLVYSYTVVLPQPWTAMSAAYLNATHIHGNPQATITSPKCLTELSQSPTYLENLRRIHYLVYIGAPCPPHLGSALAAKTRLTTAYGSTESGMYPIEIADAEDWEYIKFHERFPHELKHVSHDLYEMVLLRNQSAAFQGIFGIFPNLKEYRVQDLFARHATKPDTWAYRGRTDDLTRSSCGELFLPKQMEGIIEAHPLVEAALIYDRGAAGLSLVVEARGRLGTAEELERSLDDIWPAVQSANDVCPLKARIKRGLILWADTKRMLPKGAKGYPQRGKVLEMFGTEIDELYRKEEERAGVVIRQMTWINAETMDSA